MKRILKIAEICALLLLVTLSVLTLYGLGHFRIKFPPLMSENSPAHEIAKSVGATSQGVMKGTVPWRKVDTSSIGFPEKEARLLTLKSDVDVFILTFGHRPSHIGEISHLSETPHSDKRLRKECEIVNLEADSYILDCDSFSSISETEMMGLLKSFDKETERFYEVRGHIVLYAPPFTLGKSPVP
jgi:hypothetical protein